MARIDGRFNEVAPWSGIYDRFTAHTVVEEDDPAEHAALDELEEEDDPRQNELAADSDPALGRPRFEVELP